MKSIRFIIATMFILASDVLSARTSVPDSIEVKALQKGDSITFQLTAYQIEKQLTFLMQGLNITVAQPDTLVMSIPSAAMVRNKVKRHPNEVKAVLEKQRKRQSGQDSINHVVRPDVQPLVAALNDTTATIIYKSKKFSTRKYKIDVDREKAVMTFSFVVHKGYISTTDGFITVYLFSAPSGRSDRAEFAGRRLSEENSLHPNGLGEGIRKEDVSKRTFKKNLTIKVVEADE